jgi:hypothetical protein
VTSEPPPVVPRGGLRSEWPVLCVLAVMLLGLVVTVAFDRFRRGTVIMAGGVILAAWLRAVLPTDRAGVLAVRRRSVDVLCLASLGLGLLTVALVVPAPT